MRDASRRLAHRTLPASLDFAGTSAVVLEAAVAATMRGADATVNFTTLAASVGQTKRRGARSALGAA
jgi:hypothetical protein